MLPKLKSTDTHLHKYSHKIYTDNVTLNKLQYTFNLSEHEFCDDL